MPSEVSNDLLRERMRKEEEMVDGVADQKTGMGLWCRPLFDRGGGIGTGTSRDDNDSSGRTSPPYATDCGSTIGLFD